jgi:pantothenate kinase
MIPMPNLTLSDQAKSGSTGTMSNAFDIPFSFDHSGWNVSLHSSGNQSATGSTGQGSGAGGGALGGLLGNLDPRLLLIAGVVILLLRK